MDIGTGLALLGSAEIAKKILGPTADYVGEGLREWSEKRVNNIRAIFEIASQKLGDKIEQPGAVPPRVLRRLLEEGSYIDDELTAEYFGGLLASSRTGNSRDDRALVHANLVGQLSVYQLRAHYVLYTILKRLFDGSGLTLNMNDRPKLIVHVPFPTFATAMMFSDEEVGAGFSGLGGLVEHVFFGLNREGLIETFFYGPETGLREKGVSAEVWGVLFRPSVFGAELYLWAHGRGDLNTRSFLRPETVLLSDIGADIPSGYVAVPDAQL